jgi:hypothetical protein
MTEDSYSKVIREYRESRIGIEKKAVPIGIVFFVYLW